MQRVPIFIYGQVGAEPTLRKVFEILQWLRSLEVDECSQDSLQISSTLESLYLLQNNA